MKRENWYWLIFLILIAVVGAKSTGVSLFSTLGEDRGGFQITSISYNQATEEWIIQATAEGGHQIVGKTITPDDVKSFTQGATTEKDFTLELTSLQNYITYSITTDEAENGYVYVHSIIERGGFPYYTFPECPPKEQIGADAIYPITFDYFGTSLDWRLCIAKKRVAGKGHYTKQTLDYDAILKVSVVGETPQTVQLSATGQNSANLGVLGRAIWTGSLITGNYPPDEKDSVALYKTTSFKNWYPASESYWDAYRMKEVATEKSIYSKMLGSYDFNCGGTVTTRSSLINCVVPKYEAEYKGTNDALILATQKAPFYSENDVKEITENSLKLNLRRSFATPTFTFYLKASKVGYKSFYGVPQITDTVIPTKEQFKSGAGPAYIKVKVKNIGEQSGWFRTYYEGTKFTTSIQSPQFVKKGEEIWLEPLAVFPTLSTTQDLEEEGKLCVEDKDNPKPEGKNCISARLSMGAVQTCTATCGVNDKTIWTCDNGITTIKETCKENQRAVTGPKCYCEDIPPGESPEVNIFDKSIAWKGDAMWNGTIFATNLQFNSFDGIDVPLLCSWFGKGCNLGSEDKYSKPFGVPKATFTSETSKSDEDSVSFSTLFRFQMSSENDFAVFDKEGKKLYYGKEFTYNSPTLYAIILTALATAGLIVYAIKERKNFRKFLK